MQRRVTDAWEAFESDRGKRCKTAIALTVRVVVGLFEVVGFAGATHVECELVKLVFLFTTKARG
jgi:hypothetical protein